METITLQEMIGETITRIDGGAGDDVLRFHATSGATFVFDHWQDCCESVQIDDIAGDLADLIGSPIRLAEEVTNLDEEPAPLAYCDSYTWTFYKFATAKGAVTVRWLGESNGYYSEGVSYTAHPAPASSVAA